MKTRSDLHWRSSCSAPYADARSLRCGIANASRRFAGFPLVLAALAGAIAIVIALVFFALPTVFGLQVDFSSSNGGAGSPRVALAAQSGASAMVEVAWDEMDGIANTGDVSLRRESYNRLVGQSPSEPWSTAFVVYCGDLCGFVESTLIPRTPSAAEFRQYFEDDASKGVVHVNDGSYEPQAGDIVVLADSAGAGLGIVESFDASSDTIRTIEGDVDGGVAVANRGIEDSATAFITPSYPEIAPAPLDDGELVYIPAGLGGLDAFEGWSLITDPTSTEYRLRADAGEQYDGEGFGVIDGRYVVAVRPLYGSIGDYLTFTFEDGSTIDCIIGDVKGEDGDGVNEWGFLGGENILEFVVDTDSWYGGHENPGTPSCHPEWGQYISSCSNTGNWWGV